MQKRIMIEAKAAIQERQKRLELGIDLHPRSKEDIMSWVGYLKFVEKDSIYYGQTYEVSVKLPSSYPMDPPQVSFVTKIFHPNVKYETGEICLNLLKKEEWTIATSLYSLMIALQSIVNGPNCDSPLNLDSGNLFRNQDIVAYKSMVDYCYYENDLKHE
ncbi:Ubiquitin-conjugating enzyme E2 [Spironucleus salmonicida]|uniref:Ubiquitin-conjugating enzyme E2 n=1 Tax=Spironucleus salmonicida TaxID=348837 RepID=V6LHH4_9EUKA|nr:Ubiquitin-conjugating enzyme E2 [Spironucleus salmonicida]|eukprot:EST44020.1 Ubiquitin-conjugating enzyme E2 [Spironucleus salmonicida]